MRRLRTINEAVRFLKQQDPETSMTPYFIRRMIVDGHVPTIMTGKKYLVDLDRLLAHLDQQLESPPASEKWICYQVREYYYDDRSIPIRPFD